MDNAKPSRGARTMVKLGRAACALGVLALLAAWIAQLVPNASSALVQHLFYDSIVLTLVGIAFFLDAAWHDRGI